MKPRCLLSREEIKERVERGESFSDVAKVAGVSRERIRQIWKKKIAPGLGWEMQNGTRARKFVGTPIKRQKAREKRAGDIPSLARMKEICEREGLELEIIPTGCLGAHPMSQMVKVEGKFCNVHLLGKALPVDSKYPERVYWRLAITKAMLRKADFVVVLIKGEEETSFVYPAALLAAKYMNGRKGVTVNIPVKPSRGYHNVRPRVMHWDYEGAWDLLRGEKREATIGWMESDNSSVPSGHKSIGDYRDQLEAKRKRRKR